MNSKLIKNAFIATIPVLCGYIFMGIAFGLLLQDAGYSFLWALLMSVIIYAGTMQYMAIPFLVAQTDLITVAITTLLVHFRHFVYGLSFIDRFKSVGKSKYYIMFGLTDETYALLCSEKAPEGTNEHTFNLLIAIFNHLYWIIGCTVGAFAGQFLTINTDGIDFAMTALFIVIFVDQWRVAPTKIPAIMGMVCTIVSLIIVGPNSVLIPAIISIMVILILIRKQISSKLFIEKKEEVTVE